MATAPRPDLPLLVFPRPAPIRKESGTSPPPSLHLAGTDRQRERLAPKFTALQQGFEARRLALKANAANADPDLVVVFETVGAVPDFLNAVSHIAGMEWLAAQGALELDPDDDFYDLEDREKKVRGKLFLVGSNRAALDDVVRMWQGFEADRTQPLPKNQGAWKEVFEHLKDVRFWGPSDRLARPLRDEWRFRLDHGEALIRFEIEAWHFHDQARNLAAGQEVRRLVQDLGGRTLDEVTIDDIAYHGLLVELPADGLRRLVDDVPAPPLLLSDRVMFFRGQGQSLAVDQPAGEEQSPLGRELPAARVVGAPLVALLDGLPMANHPLLAGRVIVEDHQGWEAAYPAASRIHGTAMASLIAWGELDANEGPATRPIVAVPIMRPGERGLERTPDDRLVIDVVHAAVRRVLATAPSVRVISLSVADASRTFVDEVSPWARLIDWLQFRHHILFIVSSGNEAPDLTLPVASDILRAMTFEERASAALSTLCASDGDRRIRSPAESVNALTVGACNRDHSTPVPAHDRYQLFPDGGIAPYSCTGPGFRRAIKPDILLPGGRVLYRPRAASPNGQTQLQCLGDTVQPPGQRVAAPPRPGGDTAYMRGSSNAAALGARWAVRADDVLASLKAAHPEALNDRHDAVLIKALLAHGASLGEIEAHIGDARPDLEHWQARRRLVSRYAGLGLADVERALTCTEQRVTLLGVGELGNKKACAFHLPIPESLNASLVRRRLAITLAWLTPIHPRHSKYRVGRLWLDLPDDPLRLQRQEGDWRQLRLGTLQHEIWEGDSAVPVVAGQTLSVRVNCVADAGRLFDAVRFGLCVSLEQIDGIALPIYQQVRDRISPRVRVGPGGAMVG